MHLAPLAGTTGKAATIRSAVGFETGAVDSKLEQQIAVVFPNPN